MAKAHYVIQVPASARRVAIAAHQYLSAGPIRGVNAATVQFGHPHDSLTVVGDETPELDSHIKQTAAFIGEVANVPVIDVIKKGKNVVHWPMRNRHYQPEPTSPPAALSGPPSAPLPSARPAASLPR